MSLLAMLKRYLRMSFHCENGSVTAVICVIYNWFDSRYSCFEK